MLFKLDIGHNVFELNPELLAIAEFARLTDRQFRYVAFATDYRSPFRKLAPEERRLQAALTAGYKYQKDGKRPDTNTRSLIEGKTTAVIAAIRKYNELQKDEDYETLLSISTLIGQIRELNAKKDKNLNELEKAVKMTSQLKPLMETKKHLEDLLEFREDPVPTGTIVEDDGLISEEHLSLLDQENAAQVE